MAEDEHVITVGSYEHRLMIAGLNNYRNNLIQENCAPDAVERLLLKVMKGLFLGRFGKEPISL